MEDRRKPLTGLDRTGPRFVRQAAIGLVAAGKDTIDPSATLARPAKVLSMPVFAAIKERV